MSQSINHWSCKKILIEALFVEKEEGKGQVRKRKWRDRRRDREMETSRETEMVRDGYRCDREKKEENLKNNKQQADFK